MYSSAAAALAAPLTFGSSRLVSSVHELIMDIIDVHSRHHEAMAHAQAASQLYGEQMSQLHWSLIAVLLQKQSYWM